jgi:hypothetical protein
MSMKGGINVNTKIPKCLTCDKPDDQERMIVKVTEEGIFGLMKYCPNNECGKGVSEVELK